MENNEILDSNLIGQQTSVFENYEIASSGKRFANYVIDLVIYYILVAMGGVAYVLVFKIAEMDTLTSYLLAFIIMFLYYSIMEATTGRTVGKMITRTRVLNDDFSEPELGTIIKRTFCRFIPFDQLSFFGNGWHDSISGTVVVND